MAVLSEIRKRPIFLIAIIGLALFAFIIQEAFYGNSGGKIEAVGEVNGEEISRQEFATALENYQAQAGGRISEMQAAKIVWNGLVREKIYATQLEEAGITIGEADIVNALYDNPNIQNNPRFQSSGVFDKAKLIEYLATVKGEGGQEWKEMQNYMASIKKNLQKTTYDNLIGAGLGASLKEGEAQYFAENTKTDGKFVFVPFASIADSLITIKKSEVESYINNHKSNFEVEASRDIKYVKFDVKPTEADEQDVKAEVAKLIEDTTVGNGMLVKGLKSTTNYKDFLDENKSDLPLNENVQFKVQVPQVIAEDIFKGKVGDIFGPYKDNGYYKISKLTEVVKLPDSVSASHILIPYVGALRADAEIKRTKEKAKSLADSLLIVAKKDVSKFGDLAKDFSSDKGSSENGGKYEWFGYNRMTPAFRDFTFENEKGSIDVVETPFGYHVIKVDDQKNFQNAVKLATFARKIEASKATENTVFQNAETFVLDIANGKNIEDVAKEKNFLVAPAQNIKALDDNVPGLGNERQIVSWAFNADTKEGDYKRFDVDGGYVVATVTGKTAKGLMPVDKAITQVRPILMNQKKAKLIEDKMSGASLADIATASKEQVKEFTGLNTKSPAITGVGYDAKAVGAMVSAKEGKVYNKVVGDRGVYAFKVTKKELPTALPDYETYRKRIASQRKNSSYQMFEAIKKASDVEDGLSSYYGLVSE